jgi:hypothetical protein
MYAMFIYTRVESGEDKRFIEGKDNFNFLKESRIKTTEDNLLNLMISL